MICQGISGLNIRVHTGAFACLSFTSSLEPASDGWLIVMITARLKHPIEGKTARKESEPVEGALTNEVFWTTARRCLSCRPQAFRRRQALLRLPRLQALAAAPPWPLRLPRVQALLRRLARLCRLFGRLWRLPQLQALLGCLSCRLFCGRLFCGRSAAALLRLPQLQALLRQVFCGRLSCRLFYSCLSCRLFRALLDHRLSRASTTGSSAAAVPVGASAFGLLIFLSPRARVQQMASSALSPYRRPTRSMAPTLRSTKRSQSPNSFWSAKRFRTSLPAGRTAATWAADKRAFPFTRALATMLVCYRFHIINFSIIGRSSSPLLLSSESALPQSVSCHVSKHSRAMTGVSAELRPTFDVAFLVLSPLNVDHLP